MSTQRLTRHPWLRRGILVLAIFTALLFLSGLAIVLLDIWEHPSAIAFSFLWAFSFFHVYSYIILTPAIFYSVLLAGSVAMLLCWFLTTRRQIRALLLIGILAMVIYWLHPPFHYRPPLEPAPGHTMRIPPQPHTLFQRMQWEFLAEWDEVAPHCQYTLLGWGKSAVLYYQEDCGEENIQVWRFDVANDSLPQSILHAPASLELDQDSLAINYVRSSTYPPSSEEPTRRLIFRRPWLLSPDARWVAAVARRVYGPEDIIIVSTPHQ